MANRRGRPKHPDILTPREWEVLALLREGLSNEEIARRLGISLDGAKYHVSEILGKLGLENRADAARWRPEEARPWWLAALAPLTFWRRTNAAWLSTALAATLALAVAGGIGVLVWALVAVVGNERRTDVGQLGLIVDQPSPVFRSVDFVSKDEGWMLAGGGLLYTANGGQAWNEIARVNGTALDFIDETHGWIVGTSGSILVTTDGGRTWAEQQSGVKIHLSDIFAASRREAWAVGSGEGVSHVITYPLPTAVLHTTDGGATWRRIEVPPFTWFQDILFIGDEGWMLGSTCEVVRHASSGASCSTASRTVLLRSSNGGHDWKLLEPRLPDKPRAFDFVDEAHGWLAAECEHEGPDCSPGLFRTADGGETWWRAGPTGYRAIAGLDFRDERHGWVTAWKACDEGPCPLELLRTEDGGNEWRLIGTIDSEPSGYPSQLTANSDSVYIVGSRLAMRSTDEGETLEPMEHPAVDLGDIQFVSEEVGYSLHFEGLSRTADGGRTWTWIGDEPRLPAALHFLSQEEGYAAILADEGILVQKTDDEGRSWTSVGSLATTETPWSLHFVDEQNAWLRTNEALHYSDNGGRDWARTLPGEVVAFEPVGPRAAWAVLVADTSVEPYTYSILYTSDAGETWQTRRQIKLDTPPLADFASASAGWITAEGSNTIHFTNNGGLSWSTTVVGDGGIADIAFTDSLHGWLSLRSYSRQGSRQGQLLRTSDGGKTWIPGRAIGPHWGDLISTSSGAVWLQPRDFDSDGVVTTVDGRTLLYRIE